MNPKKGVPSQSLDTKELLHQLEERGYRGRIVSIHHLADLQEEIENRHAQGSFEEEFYRLRLAFFEFKTPRDLPEAKSIIVVAVPRPQAQAIFTFKGKKRKLILPPTYVAYEQTKSQVAEVLNRVLKEKGYSVAPTSLPLKLLAVRSGLTEYGRNNITYASGMGSFLQLVAFYSDLPCTEDTWGEARMMKQCQNCRACTRSCPTGAISSDRFLLYADRCIVFHNEKKGDVPFPSWIDPTWHNCLQGCLQCQKVCPEDSKFTNWIVEREKFSQKETELLLKNASALSSTTVEKLKNLDLADPETLGYLPRNLHVFFGSSKDPTIRNTTHRREVK